MDNREKRFHERRTARKLREREIVTSSERQLEWSEAQRAWSQDIGIAKMMYQAFGVVPVDWDDDDVYVRFGI